MKKYSSTTPNIHQYEVLLVHKSLEQTTTSPTSTS